MLKSASLTEKHNVLLHTHLAETEDENSFCLEKFGCRPVDYLEKVGWLNKRTWLARGIHFTDEEIQKLSVTKSESHIVLLQTWCLCLEAAVLRNWRKLESRLDLG